MAIQLGMKRNKGRFFLLIIIIYNYNLQNTSSCLIMAIIIVGIPTNIISCWRKDINVDSRYNCSLSAQKPVNNNNVLSNVQTYMTIIIYYVDECEERNFF